MSASAACVRVTHADDLKRTADAKWGRELLGPDGESLEEAGKEEAGPSGKLAAVREWRLVVPQPGDYGNIVLEYEFFAPEHETTDHYRISKLCISHGGERHLSSDGLGTATTCACRPPKSTRVPPPVGSKWKVLSLRPLSRRLPGGFVDV